MDLVYNIARRMVPRREDAEDLVQETYLAAFRAWQDHRRPRKVEPWLATICLNLGRSGYRHRARRPREVSWDEMASLQAQPDPEDAGDRGPRSEPGPSSPVADLRGAAPGHRPRRILRL